jgi:hypothetical protein
MSCKLKVRHLAFFTFLLFDFASAAGSVTSIFKMANHKCLAGISSIEHKKKAGPVAGKMVDQAFRASLKNFSVIEFKIDRPKAEVLDDYLGKLYEVDGPLERRQPVAIHDFLKGEAARQRLKESRALNAYVTESAGQQQGSFMIAGSTTIFAPKEGKTTDLDLSEQILATAPKGAMVRFLETNWGSDISVKKGTFDPSLFVKNDRKAISDWYRIEREDPDFETFAQMEADENGGQVNLTLHVHSRILVVMDNDGNGTLLEWSPEFARPLRSVPIEEVLTARYTPE